MHLRLDDIEIDFDIDLNVVDVVDVVDVVVDVTVDFDIERMDAPKLHST